MTTENQTNKTNHKTNGCLMVCGILIVLGIIGMGIYKIFSPSTTSQSLGIGEIGQLDNGKGGITLGIDKESYSKMLDAVNANDQPGYNELLLAGKIFLVNCPTKVRAIDSSMFLRRVRILEGPQKDLAGWCAYEYVKR